MSTLSPTGVQTGTPVTPPTITPPSPAPAPAESRRRASTLDEIRRARTHIVQGYLGHWYEIQIPDLAFMLAHGEIPEDLQKVAMLEVLNDGTTPLAEQKDPETGQPILNLELVRDFYDLRAHILVAALVNPKVELDDLAHLPTEDKDMLSSIATRQRVTDARGVRLGVARLSDWEQFRTAHGCPENCPGCEAALHDLSTVDMGGV